MNPLFAPVRKTLAAWAVLALALAGPAGRADPAAANPPAVPPASLPGLAAVEDLLLYHPMKKLDGRPKDLGLDYRSEWITTADQVRLHAWWVPAAEPKAVIHFSHGNAGNISHRLEKLEILNRLGYSVLMYDYRGFGRSAGSPSEEGLYADAQAAYDHLVTVRGVAPERIVAFGESLGGSVASHLATTNKVGAIILEGAFTSVGDMAAKMNPLFAGLTRSGFKTREFIGKARAPVLFLHSARDEMIPFAQARANFAAAPEPKKLVPLKGGHNDGFFASPKIYGPAIQSFLDEHLPAPAAPPEESPVPEPPPAK